MLKQDCRSLPTLDGDSNSVSRERTLLVASSPTRCSRSVVAESGALPPLPDPGRPPGNSVFLASSQDCGWAVPREAARRE